jgi:hypothetical protein
MPFMRRRPVLRAAAVGGGAYLAGKHRARRQAEQESQDSGQDQRVSDLEQQQADAAPPPAGAQAAAPSMTDQLNQLADLHKRGVLNDSEFAAAKSKLLGA